MAMMRRRRAPTSAVAVAVTLLTALVTGCGTEASHLRWPPPPASALLTCPLTKVQPGIQSARAQPIPAGFTAVSVIECTELEVKVAGQGEWIALAKRVAFRGIGPLMSALRMPSERPTKNLACTTDAIFVPQFVLVGKNGKIVIPKVPTTGCGKPLPQFLASFHALKFVTTSRTLQRQVLTQSEVASGCAAAWKDMLGFDTQQHGGMTPSAGGPLFRPMPKSLRVCIYRWAPDSLDTRFVRGGYVKGATEAKLLKGLTAGRSSVGCAISHTAFAIIQPAGPASSNVAWVELGGCDRLLRGNYSVGQATRAAVAIIGNVGRS